MSKPTPATESTTTAPENLPLSPKTELQTEPHVHGPGCSHHQEIQTFKRSLPKIGRNDPCSCHSGKKFKKCCGL